VKCQEGAETVRNLCSKRQSRDFWARGLRGSCNPTIPWRDEAQFREQDLGHRLNDGERRVGIVKDTVAGKVQEKGSGEGCLLDSREDGGGDGVALGGGGSPEQQGAPALAVVVVVGVSLNAAGGNVDLLVLALFLLAQAQSRTMGTRIDQ